MVQIVALALLTALRFGLPGVGCACDHSGPFEAPRESHGCPHCPAPTDENSKNSSEQECCCAQAHDHTAVEIETPQATVELDLGVAEPVGGHFRTPELQFGVPVGPSPPPLYILTGALLR